MNAVGATTMRPKDPSAPVMVSLKDNPALKHSIERLIH